jgi:hypothetical protein
VDRVNEGQLIVNYTGHGSATLWDGQPPFLASNNDVTASWRNISRLPFVVAMNCLNGLFNQYIGEESLAEAMQRAPQGGAVAVWASSSDTSPSTQALVNQELFRLIFSGVYATLGEAVAAAKRVVTNTDLRKSWIFFGDPAMRLNGAPQPFVPLTEALPPPVPMTPVDSPDNAPHEAVTIKVAANGDLQAAIDSAKAGDTIQLDAGATFVGNFVLPAKTGRAYVTIRSATPDAALPGSDARIGPAQAPLLAQIRSSNEGAALATAPGAHHYRLLFLEFGPNPAGTGGIIELGDGSAAQHSLAGVPHDLEIDRVYLHGDTGRGQTRGISLNSAATTISNSYIADINAADAPSQAIAGWNGPGPYAIVNNYIEAAGENLRLGGGDTSIPNLVPSDVTLRLNDLHKPPVRLSQTWVIANLIALNNAERVTIDGNVFEFNGAAVQAGSAVLSMAPNPSGGTPWARVAHVAFTNNVVRHAPAGISILDPTRTVADLTVRNNVFLDLSVAYGGAGRFLQLNGGLDITIDHNTVFQDGRSAVYASGAATIGFVFTNNIIPDNGKAVMGEGTTAGIAAIQRYSPGAVWLGNVVAGAPASSYPSGNAYPASLAAAGLVNLAGGGYGLTASSPYRDTATDGANPGYDAFGLVAATKPPVVVPVLGTTPAPAAPLPVAANHGSATPVVAARPAQRNESHASPAVPAATGAAFSQAIAPPVASRALGAVSPSDPAVAASRPAVPIELAAPSDRGGMAFVAGPASINSRVGDDSTSRDETSESQAAAQAARARTEPSKAGRVRKLELMSTVASPYVTGTTIAVTAEPTDGVGPYQYQWRVFDGRMWSVPTDWSEFASFTWTPDTANAVPGIMVGVRSAGSHDDTPEAQSSIRLVVTPVRIVSPPLTGREEAKP